MSMKKEVNALYKFTVHQKLPRKRKKAIKRGIRYYILLFSEIFDDGDFMSPYESYDSDFLQINWKTPTPESYIGNENT